MFIEAKDDGGDGDDWTTGAISHEKLQSNHHHQQNNIQFFTGRMPFLSPNQQCQRTEGKRRGKLFVESHRLLTLTTNESDLRQRLIDASIGLTDDHRLDWRLERVSE